MRTPEQVQVSEHVGDRIRELRIAHGWNIPMLAVHLYNHRCKRHTEPYVLSSAVLGTVERGTYAQHGYDAAARAITVDELFIFAELFDVTINDLMP